MDWGDAKILIGVAVTTLAWLITAFVAPATDKKTLREFAEKVNPDGPGWKKVHDDAKAEGNELQFTHEADSLPIGILCMVLGCVGVYGLLFSIGYFVYGKTGQAFTVGGIALVATIILFKVWTGHQSKKIERTKDTDEANS